MTSFYKGYGLSFVLYSFLNIEHENPNERSWWRRIDLNYRNSNDHMRAQVYEWRFTVPGFDHLPTSSFIGGSGWTWTNNVIDHEFTVRCVTNSAHWPISNLHYGLYHTLLRLSRVFEIFMVYGLFSIGRKQPIRKKNRHKLAHPSCLLKKDIEVTKPFLVVRAYALLFNKRPRCFSNFQTMHNKP